MKYIKKVILENFQSHKNSVIEFNNQLNVIVGPSDSGKTAILRGIKWALYNEPSGDYFIKEGENHCSVTVVFSDSTKIRRYRSKSKNSYYLYDADNKETKFEGFGTNVPQEITDTTGIKKVLLDQDHSSAINLSDQLDGAFLLSERGAIRANSIGRLVGVNVIDDSLRETLKDIRNLSSDKRHTDKKILELEEELIEYEYLEKMKNKIDNLELTRNIIYEKEQLRIRYNNIFDKFTTLLKEKEKVNVYIKKLKNIHILDDIIKDTSLSLNRYQYLNNRKNKLTSLSRDKNYNNNLIYSLKDINLVEENLKYIKLKSSTEIKIRNLKVRFTSNSSEIYKLKEVLKKLDKLERLQYLVINIDEQNKSLNVVKTIDKNVLSLKNSLAIGRSYLEKLNYTDDVSKLYDLLEKKIILYNKLNLILEKYKINKQDLNNNNDYLIKLKKTFKDDLDKYKILLVNQETCPFCFSNIDNEKIEHIINHYD